MAMRLLPRIGAGGGSAPPLAMEVTGESAVAALRARIGDRNGTWELLDGARFVLKAFGLALLLNFFLIPLYVAAALLSSLGGASLAFLAVNALYWAVAVYLHARGNAGAASHGILLGASYPRHVLQYSNSSSGQGSREGSRALVRGRAGPYRLDMLSEPNQHVLIAGSSSSGKTTTLKALLARSSLAYGIGFLAIDWQGELEGFAMDSGAALWRVPGNFTLNAFRLNGMDAGQRAAMVEEGLMLALHLTQLQATRVRDALTRLYSEGREPDLAALWSELRQRRENWLIGYRLKAVERVMGAEPPAFWEGAFSGNTVLSLAGLNDSEKSLVTYFVLQRVCELFEKGSIGSGPRLMVAIDEAWQLLSSRQQFVKLPNAHEVLAERIVRLGRKYGFGIVTSTQQLEDLPGAFLNSSSVIVLHSYRQPWNSRLGLDRLDAEYAKGAAQGECLVMDRLRAQGGQTWMDYVKVEPASPGELAALKAKGTREVTEAGRAQTGAITFERAQRAVQAGRNGIRIPAGAPSPSEHAALLAILSSPAKARPELVQFVKSKGWVRSDATLYGYEGKPGIFEKVVANGMAGISSGAYSLTEQGLRWVEPGRILAAQSDKLGSEEHKRLLVRTVEKLHESNALVISSSAKHSPDLIAWPVNGSKRYLWDTSKAKGYEIQTSARTDAVSMNEAKKKINMPITWVSENEKVLEEIKRLTNSEDRYELV
ncbi:MAG: hypothetical protein M1158_02660 [Candidatus Marsarchaeota archaeon]|nr:hypothetical protein [Candidatus Marsarchaeota archaeon]